MQTFLPYPDFRDSARALDDRRLGKQRVGAKQIYLALTDPSYGWQKHPAVLMWRPTNIHGLHALAAYGGIMCQEWLNRGYKDTLLPWFMERVESDLSWGLGKPVWVGNTDFHRSHQSNLIRKDPDHYGPQFPGVPSDLPYVWP